VTFGAAIDGPIEERFRAVRALLTLIKSSESTETPPADSEEVKILRGLFFVHLYAAFERSVTDVVLAYLRKIAEIELPYSHIECKMWPAALDPRFSSLQGSRGSAAWKKRIEISSLVESDSICSINEGMFSDKLQNVWPETIVEMFKALGLQSTFLDGAASFALKEVVEKRNQVAHGRTEPQVVGSGSTSNVLEDRLSIIHTLITNLLESMRLQLGEMAFIRQPFREGYVARVR